MDFTQIFDEAIRSIAAQLTTDYNDGTAINSGGDYGRAYD